MLNGMFQSLCSWQVSTMDFEFICMCMDISFNALFVSFSRASNDDTKKWGMMSLVNQLFKVYFGINKLNLCKPLIRAIDSSPYKDRFAVSQQVTYRYYVGRKAMFDSNYKSGKL